MNPDQHTQPSSSADPYHGEKQRIITNWLTEYGDALYSWASHKTSDDDLAQDLVQDTFLSAFQSFESFQNKSNPKTWLFSILNNKIIDHYRKAARSASRSETEVEKRAVELSNDFFGEDGFWSDRNIPAFWSSEPSLLDNPDFNNAMGSCMNKLPETWRMTVHAKYLLEKESEEICQELGISPSNYWQVLHRAKLLLKKCLEIHWVIE